MDAETVVTQHLSHADRSTLGEFAVRVDATTIVIADPVVTGQQVLEAVRKFPVDEYLIFQLLANGQLEEVRLDETVDLRLGAVEQFVTWRSDRSFRFVLDGRRFEWGAPVITGRKLKDLAGVDSSSEVWLEVHSAEHRPIGDTERVDLTAPGVERFFTGEPKVKDVEVYCDYISADEPICRNFPDNTMLVIVKQWAREEFVPNPPSDKAYYLNDDKSRHRFTADEEQQTLAQLSYECGDAHFRLNEEQAAGA